MTVRPLLGMTAAWLGLVVPLAATAHQPLLQDTQAKFRSSIDLVSVTAVVRDRKGRFVRDLNVKDFVVAEAGEPRRILDFRADTDGPVRLALVYDVSGSMRVGNKAVDARQAARHLFGALRSSDEAALFEFDTRLQRVTPFSSDFSAIDSALDHIDPPYGQTSLYDAVAETARVISDENKGAGARLPTRTAVVVLTDGVDTHSLLKPEQVSGIASAIDLPVYFLAVMAGVDDPRNAVTGAATELETGLGSLARWTGGELFTASAPAHASIAARQIVNELRHQYVLAFEASARPGWRPLEVRARDKDLIVRARAGYTAGGPAVEAGRSGPHERTAVR
jgi:Ca-activated chloride channel homolog